jgi:hypothetical protein
MWARASDHLDKGAELALRTASAVGERVAPEVERLLAEAAVAISKAALKHAGVRLPRATSRSIAAAALTGAAFVALGGTWFLVVSYCERVRVA